MRILLVNKFYYPRGGDCTAVISTEQLLREHGHQVAVFSTRHPENIPSQWEEYFAEAVSFDGGGLTGKLKAAARLFGSSEVARNFRRLLADFKPDVVHLHNIHSHLSPVVAAIAHRQGVRVVWTLHDYKLICPAYSCLRDGKPCELCYTKKSFVLTKRCMKNSRAASLLALAEALYWNRPELERITDRFISPSAFLKEKMVSAGFRPSKIEVLHNFMYRQLPPVASKDNYYCYVGRLSAEKGVDDLLEAARQLPYPLKIIGSGALLETCRQRYNHPHIEFVGQTTAARLLPLVQRAQLLVAPSVWYENNPYSIIEALCLGVPVLGARIGGIPELIDPGRNGDLFTPGNIIELQSKIAEQFNHPYDYAEIASNAQERFSAETFYGRLMELYI
ncbi:MAG: glycosyltransferase [Tannerella sp.]|jgi:glycosyltransferase involved in cell wall biosynthesis|nr:glycosyltransferase [Tannerella sp.]